MIAAMCGWHENHSQAAAEIQRQLDRRRKMLIAAPALVETYSVLTRLPPPHRLSTRDALTLLEANFMKTTEIVALDYKSYCSLLKQASGSAIAGGQIYDVVIAACALRARARTLLTFNPTDFSFAQKQIDILVPGSI